MKNEHFIPRCFLMCWLIAICKKSVSAILFTPQIHFRLLLKLTQNIYWSFKENYASYIKILVTKATIIFINYYIYIWIRFFFQIFLHKRELFYLFAGILYKQFGPRTCPKLWALYGSNLFGILGVFMKKLDACRIRCMYTFFKNHSKRVIDAVPQLKSPSNWSKHSSFNSIK